MPQPSLSLVATGVVLALASATATAQDCDTKGGLQTLGVGTPGASGIPLLRTVGLPLEQKVLWFEVDGALPGGHGCLFGGLGELALFAPEFGAVFHPEPPLFIQTFSADHDGGTGPLFALPVVPDLCGLELVAQAVLLDPVAQGGIAFTHAVRASFAGPAEGLLFQPTNFPAGGRPDSVAAGDLNGDGFLDLALSLVGSSSDPSGLAVLFGHGDGTFAEPLLLEVPCGRGDVAISDLDGDGALDLVTTSFGSASECVDGAAVLLGHGDGSFAAAQYFAAGAQPLFVVSEDLDGDGVPDLAVVDRSASEVLVLLGLGDGTFGAAQGVTVGPYSEALAVGDLNGDGVPDLAVVDSGLLGPGSVMTFLGGGDGTFAPDQALPVPDSPEAVALADLDGDGALDLIVPRYQSLDASILLGVGDGTFGVELSATVGSYVNSVAVRDLDGDGVLDLVAVNGPALNTASVLLGHGDGTFAPRVVHPVGDSPRGVAVEDLDGDGELDLAVSLFGTEELIVLPGFGDGEFETQPVFPAGAGPNSAVAADLDGDGDEDLIVLNSITPPFPLPASGQVSVLVNLGVGSFAEPQSYDVGAEPRASVVRDLDGDGVLDLAVSCSGDVTVWVLLGLGDGTFQAGFSVPASLGPPTNPGAEDIASADLNGDAVPDLVVVHGSYSYPYFTVLLGTGDGTFEDPQGVRVSDIGHLVAIGDLDTDGAPDVVVTTNLFPAQLVGYFGRGDGTFTAAETLPQVGELWLASFGGLAIEDLDGDGALDVLATQFPNIVPGSSPDGRVLVFLGNGDGTFADSAGFPAGSDPRSPGIGDLDGDGRVDLAVTDWLGRTITLLSSLGGGAFASPWTFTVAGEPGSIALADLDGDGALDLAATVWEGNTGDGVVVWPNKIFE